MENQSQEQMKAQNIPNTDQVDKNKSIYDVSGFEVFWRNFLAGASRTFGAILMYVLIFAIIGSIANKHLMPKILPLIDTLQTSVESLQNLQKPNSQNQIIDSVLQRPDLQNILNQVNR